MSEAKIAASECCEKQISYSQNAGEEIVAEQNPQAK
jgi:hypothetical protein